MKMRDIISLVESAEPLVMYHITSKPRFKLDPNFAPEDNAFSLDDRSGHKGIYLTKDVERWVNGHGYIRPFVVEFLVDPSVLEHDKLGRWGGEVFVPAEHFDKLKIVRVVPLDVISREKYGLHGWIEGSHGHEFDTGDEIDRKNYARAFPDGYRYDKDARTMSKDEVQNIQKHFKVGYKNRMRG